MNQLDMTGRNVIVTGGASGIGLAISRRLVQSGANVALWDVNEKAMAVAARSFGPAKTHTAAVDVSKLGRSRLHSPRPSPCSIRSTRW